MLRCKCFEIAAAMDVVMDAAMDVDAVYAVECPCHHFCYFQPSMDGFVGAFDLLNFVLEFPTTVINVGWGVIGRRNLFHRRSLNLLFVSSVVWTVIKKTN